VTDPLVPLRHSANPDVVGRLLAKAAPSMKTPALGAEARAKILSSLPSAAAPAASTLTWAKAAGVVALGLGVLGAVAWSTLGTAPRAGDPATMGAPTAQAPIAPPSALAPPPPASAPAAVFSVHDLPTALPPVAPAERPAAPTPALSTDTLSREVKILDRARAESDPGARLRILGEHERAFPNGELAPEREVFAVEALLKAGRSEEARARGEAFVRTQPTSAHAARVRALLGAVRE